MIATLAYIIMFVLAIKHAGETVTEYSCDGDIINALDSADRSIDDILFKG